jgi:UDP-N-acetyl-D-mannosaminuronic acid dehydrogenase
MQLAAFCKNQFSLGYDAMMVNEGLPLFLVEQLERKHNLETMTVGLLGMAFKAGSDDIRAALSYKLKKLLEFRCRAVLTTDPHVTRDPALRPVGDVIRESDLLILCIPHPGYAGLDLKGKPVVDIWNFFGKGGSIL